MTRLLKFLISATLFSSLAFADAEPVASSKSRDARKIYKRFVAAGVPEVALKRVLDFLKSNAGKTVSVSAKIRPSDAEAFMGQRRVTIQNDYATIIDFSRPSDQKRLYFLHLKTGKVDRHLVAHGKGSGVRKAGKFSNIEGSKMSSLGLFLGGNPYYGTHGQSLNLYGLEKSNDAAASRDIVIHGAPYVTPEFIEKEGRAGRSWGCPAVEPTSIGKMLRHLKEGRVVYGFHSRLMKRSKVTPILQQVDIAELEADVDL
ncbi:hypothetical protein D3C87_146050 [compost metagenome]